MARHNDKYYFGDGSEGAIRFTGYPPSSMKDFSEDELDKIYELYHQGEKITKIREQFPKIIGNSFQHQLPYVRTEEKCEKCNGFLYVNYTRTLPSPPEVFQTICIGCGHFPYNSAGCDCEYCQAERKQEVEENKKRYYDFLNKTYKLKPNALRLDLFEEIYLFLTILNYGGKDREYLRLDSWQSRYTNRKPSKFDQKINQFIQREILIPYPASFRHSYLFEEGKMEGKVLPDDRQLVDWKLNLYSKGELQDLKSYMTYFNGRLFTDKEKSVLWREVYKHEIANYLRHKTAGIVQIGLDEFLIDYVTDAMIETFSLSKTFSFLYSAVKATLYYQSKYNPDKQKVKSYFKNRIAYYADNYKHSKTQKGFNRPSGLYQDLLHTCIIQQVLDLDDNYFYLYTEEIIPNYQSEDFIITE